VTRLAVAVVARIAPVIFVLCPLSMEAIGPFQPKKREVLYAPMERMVKVIRPGLKPGDWVTPDQELIQLYSLELKKQIVDLQLDIAQANNMINNLRKSTDPSDITKVDENKIVLSHKNAELAELRERTNASQE